MSISPQAVAELEVVAGLEVELAAVADLAHLDGVLLGSPSGASGSGRFGSASGELAELGLDRAQLVLAGLDRAPSAPAPRHQPPRRRSPARFASAICLERVLRSPWAALDLGQQLRAAGVELQQLVDLVGGAAPRQRGLDAARGRRGSA